MFYAQPWRGSPYPVVALLHGALRSSVDLHHWIHHLQPIADVVLIDLPGHGRSDPIAPATLEALVATISHGLQAGLRDRQVVLVGESLGGLVALGIGGLPDPGPVVGVLAADPPLATKKLLNVHRNIQKFLIELPDHRFLKSMAFEVFGVTKDSAEDRIYYPVLDKLKVPAVILAGDLELFPPRDFRGVACLLDSVDRFILEQFYRDKVEVHQIRDSGHLLLVDRVGPSLGQIKTLLKRTVGDLAAAPAK